MQPTVLHRGHPAGPGEPDRAPPVKLWFCTNEELAAEFAQILAGAWLDAPERELAERFLFERDRHQYLIAHVLVRRVLALETGVPESEAVIWRSPRGRPFFRKPPKGCCAAAANSTSTSPTPTGTTCWAWCAATASVWTSNVWTAVTAA